MVCICTCGREYGFEPIGYWFCHGCWRLNDSGPVGFSGPVKTVEPEEAERLMWEDPELGARADSLIRGNPDSWKAWYTLGAAYAAREEMIQAGSCWTRAAYRIRDSAVELTFLHRTIMTFVRTIMRIVTGGGVCMTPYTAGMKYICVSGLLPGDFAYCEALADSLYDESEPLDTVHRFRIVNLCSQIRASALRVRTDLRQHRDIMNRIVRDVDRFCLRGRTSISPLMRKVERDSVLITLWLTMPYRVARDRVSHVISETTDSEIDRLSSLQPNDGTAAFAGYMSRAIRDGYDLAFLRVDQRKDDVHVFELEDRVFREISDYIDSYIAGDTSKVPENRVYLELTLNQSR